MAGPPPEIRRGVNSEAPPLNVIDFSIGPRTSKGTIKEIKWNYDAGTDTLSCGEISVSPAGIKKNGVSPNNATAFDQLKHGGVINKGHFATVVKAMWKGDQKKNVMALKCYQQTEEGREKTAGGVVYEIQTLLHPVDHENVLKYIDIFCVKRTIYVLMEYANMGSLMNLVERYGPLSADLNVSIMRQVLFGLHALHKAGFIHRYLKPSDILFNGNGSIKIGNFSVAKYCASGSPPANTTLLDWRSFTPEQVRGEEQDVKVDSFAFGSVLGYCAYGFNPLISKADVQTQLATYRNQLEQSRGAAQQPGADTTETISLVSALIKSIEIMANKVPFGIDFEFLDYVRLRCYGPNPPIDAPASMQSLMRQCLNEKPAQRPSCDEMLKDELFGGPDQTRTEEQYREESKAKVRQRFEAVGCKKSTDFGETLPPQDAVQLMIARLHLAN